MIRLEVFILAHQTFQILCQPFPTLAHPADGFAGVSHQGVIRDIPIYQRSSADKGVSADSQTADDSSIRTQGGAFKPVIGDVANL